MNDSYFNWLVDLIANSMHRKSYISLLYELNEIPFTYDADIFPNDRYRAEAGLALQYEYASITGDKVHQRWYTCSVLEMMIALARKAENISGRSIDWFWMMIDNLGLASMYERHFDSDYVAAVIERFLDRDYSPNGSGGLFYIPGTSEDLRKVEIWYQMCWYQNYIWQKEGK